MSPIVIGKFVLSDKMALGVRAEYYEDKSGVIIATGTPNGFKTFGYSANFDYQLSPSAVWRIEIRNLTSKDEIFIKETMTSKNNTFLSTSMAINF
jgi:hypothetical protein